MKEIIKNKFIEAFGSAPAITVRAPGRINLIGEHTDYNDGFVLPAAVDKEIVFGFSNSGSDANCTVLSLDFDERFEFKLSEINQLAYGSWQNYIIGVAAEIMKIGKALKGFNMVFSGNIPQGSGMSSSAALECGTCVGLDALFQLKMPRLQMAKLAQHAEHNYAGVKCGIMDQFASMMGKEGHALRLDCQNLLHTYFPVLLDKHSIILCNSNVEHSLASSEYNVRREQCEEGVAVLGRRNPQINSLRDITMKHLQDSRKEMPEVVFRRCKYIVEENGRVERFASALMNNDLFTAGEILKEAQFAMRYEYEITCPEIDFMADFANTHSAVLGGRMMGGGFGGCTLNLVRKGAEDDFVKALSEAYHEKYDKDITPIPVNIANGVSAF